MSDKYRPDGSPYPEGDEGLFEWAKDIEDNSKRLLRQETLPNGIRLSTVWLGLDHRFGKGPPLIFETMAFQDGDEILCERYSTRTEALDGHERLKKTLLERGKGEDLEAR